MGVAKVVADSSAALAVLLAEPGASVVERFLGDGLISTVNFSEVVSRLIDRGSSPQVAETLAAGVAFRREPYDEALALRAGTLRAVTRRHGLSLGDRACLALAERERLPVLTADRAWADLDIGVEIRLIR